MISVFYASLMGFVYFWMSFRVILLRRKHLIAHGYGKSHEIAGPVSGTQNFIAYIPFLLVLLMGVEIQGVLEDWFFHLIGGALFVGRLSHAYGLQFCEGPGKKNFLPRKIGMHLTLWPMLILLIVALFSFVYLSWIS